MIKFARAGRVVRKERAKRRVTLADVAAKAGVSVATASVAITGRPSGNCRVSPAVAEKIRGAARTLNYRPNLQARNLSTQRTQTVAILVKRAAWHHAMPYVAAAQRVLRQRGYIETFTLAPDNLLETERANLELCIERRVEGIIAMPLIDVHGRANVELYNQIHREEQIPVVHLGLSLPDCAAAWVVTDEAEGLFGAVRLLHAMGHRRIAHATVRGFDNPDPLNPYRMAYLRYDGYRRGMAELGLAEQIFFPEELVKSADELFDNAVKLSPQVVSASPRPTAVITFSDYTAAGLIAGLSAAGVRVPQDISILGVGEQPFDRMLLPALSTLAPQYEKMGETATNLLLDMIDGREVQSVAIAPKLAMRDSVIELK
jgi:LacI family transcriptional regulator, galactose operon repressor